jgi:hypothetical protein
MSVKSSPCQHCERQPAVTVLGLCAVCDRTRNIRLLYLPHVGSTPQWEAHLRRLAERARRGLPLFPDSP